MREFGAMWGEVIRGCGERSGAVGVGGTKNVALSAVGAGVSRSVCDNERV